MRLILLILFLITCSDIKADHKSIKRLNKQPNFGIHNAMFQITFAIIYKVIPSQANLDENSCSESNNMTTEEITKNYLDAFYELNYELLSKYYTVESIWHDPSAALIFPNTKKSVGKDKIIEDIQKGFSGVYDANYMIEKAFYSGPFVGIWGTYSYKIPAKYFQGLQDSDAVFKFNIPMITNLLIKDGKVLEHIEHADWQEWARQAHENAQNSKQK